METTAISRRKRSLPGVDAVAEDSESRLHASRSASDYFDAQEEHENGSESEMTHESRARSCFNRVNRSRIFAGKVVNSEKVQILIVVLIAINGILLGIGTFDFVDDNKRIHDIFNAIDQVFLIIFTIELGFQFLYHGWRLLLDGWLVFDLIVITISWAFSSLQIVRAFRIFRALRLVTRIKTMKNLVSAIFGVMPRIMAISLLLSLIFYIFSVMFTALFSDLYERGFTEWDYFGRLDLSFFTLFQIMVSQSILWLSFWKQVKC